MRRNVPGAWDSSLLNSFCNSLWRRLAFLRLISQDSLVEATTYRAPVIIGRRRAPRKKATKERKKRTNYKMKSWDTLAKKKTANSAHLFLSGSHSVRVRYVLEFLPLPPSILLFSSVRLFARALLSLSLSLYPPGPLPCRNPFVPLPTPQSLTGEPQ
jgi:hypothetical protein